MKIKVGEFISVLQKSTNGRDKLEAKIKEQEERRYNNRSNQNKGIPSSDLLQMNSVDYKNLRRYQMAKLFQYYKDQRVIYRTREDILSPLGFDPRPQKKPSSSLTGIQKAYSLFLHPDDVRGIVRWRNLSPR